MRPTTIERSPEMAPGVGAEIWKCTGEPRRGAMRHSISWPVSCSTGSVIRGFVIRGFAGFGSFVRPRQQAVARNGSR